MMLLINWWNLRTRNPIAAFIAKTLPAVICWGFWRTRCSSKFEDENPSLYRTKTNVILLSCRLQGSSLARPELEQHGVAYAKYLKLKSNKGHHV